jgi:transcriptional regulator with XRE-family HTH domain
MKRLDKILGKNVRKLREKKSITQTKLAKIIKVKGSTLSLIECGKQKLTPHQLYCLSQVLNTKIDTFFKDL